MEEYRNVRLPGQRSPKKAELCSSGACEGVLSFGSATCDPAGAGRAGEGESQPWGTGGRGRRAARAPDTVASPQQLSPTQAEQHQVWPCHFPEGWRLLDHPQRGWAAVVPCRAMPCAAASAEGRRGLRGRGWLEGRELQSRDALWLLGCLHGAASWRQSAKVGSAQRGCRR